MVSKLFILSFLGVSTVLFFLLVVLNGFLMFFVCWALRFVGFE